MAPLNGRTLLEATKLMASDLQTEQPGVLEGKQVQIAKRSTS